MTSRYLKPPRPRLFAHRGSAGRYPENTLPAFASAVAAGLQYLEMDVWTTRDGEVMVHHDPTTGRLCDRDISVAESLLDDLRRLDAGFHFSSDGGRTFPHRSQGIRIPTLREVLEQFPAAFCNIEIKQDDPGADLRVLETIRQAGAADRVLLAAEKNSIMNRLRPVCEELSIPTSLSFGETAAFFTWLEDRCSSPYRPPGVALQIPPRWGDRTLVTPDSVRAAHAVGLEVHVWTVNQKEEIEELLELDVDGVMSDYPDLLAGWLDREEGG